MVIEDASVNGAVRAGRGIFQHTFTLRADRIPGTRRFRSRLVEALPWAVWKFTEMDWEWLITTAKVHDLQNRLGFVTNVARRLAEQADETEKAAQLSLRELELERSRLAREGTLCHDSLTASERRWLRKNRSAEARRWRLLTDLAAEHLTHAA